MIKEAYCSFEVAKLLKEKGFNEKVISYYDLEGQGYFISPRECNVGTGSVYAAPTQQMAMAWLREVHDIFIKLEFDVDEDIQWHPSLALIKGNKYIHTNELQWYDSYEEACEAALKYTLENLI